MAKETATQKRAREAAEAEATVEASDTETEAQPPAVSEMVDQPNLHVEEPDAPEEDAEAAYLAPVDPGKAHSSYEVGEKIAEPGTSWVSFPEIEYEVDEETGCVVAVHERA